MKYEIKFGDRFKLKRIYGMFFLITTNTGYYGKMVTSTNLSSWFKEKEQHQWMELYSSEGELISSLSHSVLHNEELLQMVTKPEINYPQTGKINCHAEFVLIKKIEKAEECFLNYHLASHNYRAKIDLDLYAKLRGKIIQWHNPECYLEISELIEQLRKNSAHIIEEYTGTIDKFIEIWDSWNQPLAENTIEQVDELSLVLKRLD